MKNVIIAAAVSMMSIGLAYADDAKPAADSAKGPGTVGAMKEATPPGVATNPQQVDAQQGKADEKHSPGTVGAAPGVENGTKK